MTNWQKHWAEAPQACAEDDFLRQVGKTVGGKPINERLLSLIIDDICRGLDLQPDDELLDLCCGNGLLTYRMAQRCKLVCGVDYSKPLIEIANKTHRLPHVSYCALSLFDLEQLPKPRPRFTKVMMYEALQYFKPTEFQHILQLVTTVAPAATRIFVGSIPDRERRFRFVNTAARKLTYLFNILRNRDPVGYWWRRDDLKDLCRRLSFDGQALEQNQRLHTSHYRFDFLAKPRLPDA